MSVVSRRMNKLGNYRNLPWTRRIGGRDHQEGTSDFEYRIHLYLGREIPVSLIEDSLSTEV